MATKLTLLFISLSLFLLSCDKESGPDAVPPLNITITAIKPTHGRMGTTDTILGKGFDRIPTPDSVLLNGQRLDIISKTDEQVIVKIPALAGSGAFEVWYNGKMYRSPVFTYDSTLFLQTIAGSLEEGYADGKGSDARFRWLTGIAVDKAGNVFVSEDRNNTIRKITPQGWVTTFAGSVSEFAGFVDGKGAEARFSHPEGLTFDEQGYLYVAERLNCRIRKISPSGEVSTFSGLGQNFMPRDGFKDGTSSVATFNGPTDVAIDKSGNVFVADMDNNKIRKITPQGNVSTLAGGDYYNSGLKDGKGPEARFSNPYNIAINPTGTLFVTDGDSRLRKISPEGDVTTPLGPGSNPRVEMAYVSAVEGDNKGNVFFAAHGVIYKMTPDGNVTRAYLKNTLAA